MRHTQFQFFTPEEAAEKLRQMPQDGENHLDRIALQRRAFKPVTTPDERAAVRAYNLQREQERASHAKASRKRTPATARDAPLSKSTRRSRSR